MYKNGLKALGWGHTYNIKVQNSIRAYLRFYKTLQMYWRNEHTSSISDSCGGKKKREYFNFVNVNVTIVLYTIYQSKLKEMFRKKNIYIMQCI